MPTKITVIYNNPTDPDAFEAGYLAEQVDLAKKLPGLQKIETAKVWPKEDGTPTPAYRLVDLYFADYDTASAAVATAEAGALFPSIFGLATGGVTITFADIEESTTL
ncbi:MAG: EthD family reductase [Glaciihabitans sp.]|nr:EthD family reductase [Glaciihabitans sp.]